MLECDIDMNARQLSPSLLAFGTGFSLAYLLFNDLQLTEITMTATVLIFMAFNGIPYLMLTWIANHRGKAVDDSLPDFLSLVAGNIKSGLTLDKALITSSRKEFGPLAREVDRATKQSIGAGLSNVLKNMGKRIRSKNFEKTTNLIAEGVRSGGDMGRLLEKTSADLRRFETVKKEIEASISLYVIFIILASSIGAPFLYALATHLSSTMQMLKPESTPGFGKISQPMDNPEFDANVLSLFSSAAILVTTFFGSMAMGVIRYGKRLEGLKYFVPMAIIALTIFYGSRHALTSLLPVIG